MKQLSTQRGQAVKKNCEAVKKNYLKRELQILTRDK